MASDTLLIRHLPVSLSTNEIEDFLRHIGAVEVAVRESKIRKHSIAFAKYGSSFKTMATFVIITFTLQRLISIFSIDSEVKM